MTFTTAEVIRATVEVSVTPHFAGCVALAYEGIVVARLDEGVMILTPLSAEHKARLSSLGVKFQGDYVAIKTEEFTEDEP